MFYSIKTNLMLGFNVLNNHIEHFLYYSQKSRFDTPRPYIGYIESNSFPSPFKASPPPYKATRQSINKTSISPKSSAK